MTKQLIDGAVGTLEIRFAEPGSKHVHTGTEVHEDEWVLLCHPHPQFGGTMDNKVVTTLERAFQGLGYGTIAFNFRGVGRSEGSYDGGDGEQEDLKSVAAWLNRQCKVNKLILAGFSFGGYIALKKHHELACDGLCLVAPAIGLYDFSNICVEVPWVVIQGGQDEVIDAQEVLDWVRKQKHQPDIYWRGQASHFFHRQLVWLKQVISLSY